MKNCKMWVDKSEPTFENAVLPQFFNQTIAKRGLNECDTSLHKVLLNIFNEELQNVGWQIWANFWAWNPTQCVCRTIAKRGLNFFAWNSTKYFQLFTKCGLNAPTSEHKILHSSSVEQLQNMGWISYDTSLQEIPPTSEHECLHNPSVRQI